MNKLFIIFSLLIGVIALKDYQTNDIKVLNYALTLEHLEYSFYRNGLSNLTAQSFINAGYNASVYNYLTLIMMHESNHVDYLTNAIKTRKGTPVDECSYNFGNAYASPLNFLRLASVLENTGVGAYDGSIARISELELQTAAATVATVEARHASYLNNLVGLVPFPSVFDNATTPTEVIAAANTFIVTCDSTTTKQNIMPQLATFSSNKVKNQTQANNNDIGVLKYALTLEQLELTFYNQGLANFSNQDFINAGYNASVRDYIVLIQSHEATHVAALSQTIASATGSNEVLPCRYNFGYTNVLTFLQTASLLENTGVMAYDGAIDGISNLDYRTVAATIATVEGRHASYLNTLVGLNPFPNTFDIAANRTTILADAGMFIIPGSCPYNLNATNFVAANFSPATITTGNHSSGSKTAPFATAFLVLMVILWL